MSGWVPVVEQPASGIDAAAADALFVARKALVVRSGRLPLL
jgi:hypothetical protein